MMRLSRFLALSFVVVMVLLQVDPSSCNSGDVSSPSTTTEHKHKNNEDKKNKKRMKNPAPMPAPRPRSNLRGEDPNGQQSSNTPSVYPPTCTTTTSNSDITPTKTYQQQFNVTATPSPSFTNSISQEETPSFAPVDESPIPNSVTMEPMTDAPVPTSTTSKKPNAPLPTQDQTHQIIQEPTAPVTARTEGTKKNVDIMLISFAAILGAMLAFGIWYDSRHRRRSLEGASNAPLV